MIQPIRPFRSLFTAHPRSMPTKHRGTGVPYAVRVIGRVWRTVSLWIGGAVLAVIGVSVVWSFMVAPSASLPTIPAKAILSIVLDQPLEDEAMDPFAAFGHSPAINDVRTLNRILDRAAHDPHIQAVVIEVTAPGALSVTGLETLQPSLQALRDKGKQTAFIAPDIDGLVDYAFASATGSIWLSSVGTIEIAGLSMEQPFARALLDRLGIAPAIIQRKEYKTAYENLINKQMSAPNRRMSEALMRDIGDRLVGVIALGRDVDPARVTEWIKGALWSGESALAAGLIDHRGTVADLEDEWKDLFDKGAEWVDATDYAHWIDNHPPVPFGKTRVAHIPVRGVIMNTVDTDQWSGEDLYGADEIAEAIIEAGDDPSIKALIVTINSPGGVPSAAETIAAAIDRVRAAYPDKPVYVSMGDVAASGGYWIAAAAERIYALPSTLTGSIGVVGGKFVFAQASENASVAWESIDYGPQAGLTSPFRPYTDAQVTVVNTMMDHIYDAFIERVAKGRPLTPMQIEQVAKGRVWTGQQALAHGLVDQIGGLDVVLDDLAKRLGKADKEHLDLVKMPPDPTPFERLAVFLTMGARAQAAMTAFMAPWHAITQSSVLVYDPVISGPVR